MARGPGVRRQLRGRAGHARCRTSNRANQATANHPAPARPQRLQRTSRRELSLRQSRRQRPAIALSGRITGWSVSLSQPIYDANAFANRAQLLKGADRARVEFRVAEQDLILRTTQACFDVLLAQNNLTLVRAQKDAISQQLAQAKKTFSLGLSTITDTDEAQARYDTIIAAEIAARSDLQVKAAAYTQPDRSRSRPVANPRRHHAAPRSAARHARRAHGASRTQQPGAAGRTTGTGYRQQRDRSVPPVALPIVAWSPAMVTRSRTAASLPRAGATAPIRASLACK